MSALSGLSERSCEIFAFYFGRIQSTNCELYPIKVKMLLQKRSIYGKYPNVQVVFVVLIRVVGGVRLYGVVECGEIYVCLRGASVLLEISRKGAKR